MTTESEVELHPAVAAVAKAVVHHDGGQHYVPDEQFDALARKFDNPKMRPERRKIGMHLAALAFKYERVDRERTRKAVGQILVLLGLVSGFGETKVDLESDGSDVDRHVGRVLGKKAANRAKTLAAMSPPKAAGAIRPSKPKTRS